MTPLPHSNKERPFLPRINDGGILARLDETLDCVRLQEKLVT